MSRIYISDQGVEITSYDNLQGNDIEKIIRFDNDNEIETMRVHEALVDVLMKKPFVDCFEDEPRTIRILSDFSAELLSFVKDILVEGEYFRAAEECINLINEIKEIEDGEI